MVLSDRFQLADGSVVGRGHIGRKGVLRGLNNQDSFAYKAEKNYIVAVVCDGCGSSHFSEFGSRLGSLLFVNCIEKLLSRDIQIEDFRSFFTVVLYVIIDELRKVAHLLAGSNEKNDLFKFIVSHHLLFTIVGTVITPDWTVVVSIGDGVYHLNDNKKSSALTRKMLLLILPTICLMMYYW